jgi:hypothetical protein
MVSSNSGNFFSHCPISRSSSALEALRAFEHIAEMTRMTITPLTTPNSLPLSLIQPDQPALMQPRQVSPWNLAIVLERRSPKFNMQVRSFGFTANRKRIDLLPIDSFNSASHFRIAKSSEARSHVGRWVAYPRCSWADPLEPPAAIIKIGPRSGRGACSTTPPIRITDDDAGEADHVPPSRH